MQYLITGAAGFLGSALANKLALEGHTVYGLDDLSAGSQNALSMNIKIRKGGCERPFKVMVAAQEY